MSELGSNIVELCPVGALTSKIYSFKYRAWDSQYYESVDFSDSLCSSIRIFTNLNKIIRILPQYDEATNWNFLTEKARFLYDGINIQRIKFPSIKKFDNFNYDMKKIYYSISWEKLKIFLLNFYFNIFKLNIKIKKNAIFKFKPIIGDVIDIELISQLKQILYKNEQSLILNGTDNLLLKSFTPTCLNYDLRLSYILKNLNFNNYNLLLLLNTNLRFENALINAKIRQEYLWNNLLIYNFGSKYNLTYKYFQLGNNTHQFIKFIKGQHFLTNLFVNKKFKPLILISSNLLQQYDSFFYKNFFSFLKRISNFNINYICYSSARTGSVDLGFYSGIHIPNSFNLLYSNNFSCYLYMGYNFNLKNNKNLLKYNSKILNVYQNSHWDENFDFVDIVLPNILCFEKRTYLYINCLGLIKRIPALFSNINKNLLNDIEILSLFIRFLPQFNFISNTTNATYGLFRLIPIGAFEKYFNNINLFNINNINISNYNEKSYLINTIFNLIYKDLYKTNIISFYSNNMNILHNSLFINNSNFRL